MNKKTVNIKGMHCRSCEILLENSLGNITGVNGVKVSEKTGTAEIIGNNFSMSDIETAVKKAGYGIGRENMKPLISSNIRDYYDLGIAVLILLLLYRLLGLSGFSGFFSSVSLKPENLIAVILVGLAAGFSTCMALVGGLVLGLSSSYAKENPDADFGEKLKPQIFFNTGRIISFLVFGGTIGLLGSVFALSVASTAIMTMVVAVIMLTLGIQLTGIFPRFSQGFIIPKFISRKLGLGSGSIIGYSSKTAFITGAVTFFVPCGFTQAMQLYAVGSGSFVKGAMIMAAFAVGTLPGLLGIGTLSSFFKGRFLQYFLKFAGVSVIALSIFNFSNGMNLLGLSPVLSSNQKSSEGISDQNMENNADIQIVRMDQLANGYSPNKFTIKKDIPVKWIVNSRNPNSCAASIYSAKLGIRKNLNEGENIFEFIPKETGQIKFSCSMGMYNGEFEVVE